MHVANKWKLKDQETLRMLLKSKMSVNVNTVFFLLVLLNSIVKIMIRMSSRCKCSLNFIKEYNDVLIVLFRLLISEI